MRKWFIATAEEEKKKCSLCYQNFVSGQEMRKEWNAYETRSCFVHKICPNSSMAIQEEDLSDWAGNSGEPSIPQDFD